MPHKPAARNDIDTRYIVRKPGRGGVDRWFWQPRKALRDAGFAPVRLNPPAAAWPAGEPIDALEAATRARPHNAAVDAWIAGGGAAAGQPAAVPARPELMTFAELVARYRSTKRWREHLSAGSRRAYLSYLEPLLAWCGDQPIGALDKATITAFYEREFERAPSMANQVVDMLGRVLGHAVREGWLNYNPVPAVERGRPPEPVRGLWSREAIDTFVETADAMGWFSVGTAWILGEWIGQRKSDLVRLRRSIYRDGNLVFRQQKRRAGVWLPVDMVPQLADRLERQLAANDARDPVPLEILVNDRTGRPWTVNSFDRAVDEIRRAAARRMPFVHQDHDPENPVPMTDMHTHWLRHTAVSRLFEADVDPATISKITGHSARQVELIVGTYFLATKKLSRNAFRKRLDAEGAAPDAAKLPKVGQ